jgi:hypothetical protein
MVQESDGKGIIRKLEGKESDVTRIRWLKNYKKIRGKEIRWYKNQMVKES